MNLHEYQAKELLASYKIIVQSGIIATTAIDAKNAYKALNSKCVVIKAQVHAGGRGKAGGVKIANSVEEAEEIASNMLGKMLITYQTDSAGQPVNSVYLCKDIYPIKTELYFAVVIDRVNECISFVSSTEGGVDIEYVAAHTPEKIITTPIDPLIGLQTYQAKKVAQTLNLQGKQIEQFIQLMKNTYQLFIEKDIALLEINPLAIDSNDNLICVDAKINLDGSALYRNDLLKFRDISQENPLEVEATKHELNYVALDGNIGCMVNGAGLAMATMDIIKLYGGEPANFLDVGGSATKQRVMKALEIILIDKKVKAVLINIFGGIVRCDMIAEAIVEASKEIDVTIPIVVRLAGNNAHIGAEILNNSKLKLYSANNLADAAEKVVRLAI